MTPDVPSDPPRQRVRLQSGVATYTDEGEGPVLLAVHGLPGSARDWRWLAPAFDEKRRLIRVELPGFGESTPNAESHIRAQVAFLIEFVDRIGLRRFSVMGHSMGGAMALGLAALLPDRVMRLVLLSSLGLRPHRSFRKVGRYPTLSKLFAFPPTRAVLLPNLRRRFERLGFSSDLSDIALAQTAMMVGAFQFSTLQRWVKRVQAPSMVAWAEDDRIVEACVTEELAMRLPAGPRLAFEAGGHNIQKTQAVEIAEVFLAWSAAEKE